MSSAESSYQQSFLQRVSTPLFLVLFGRHAYWLWWINLSADQSKALSAFAAAAIANNCKRSPAFADCPRGARRHPPKQRVR
jgi:hypothetical protein